MSLYKIQGKKEKKQGIYYEFDSDDTPLGEGGMGKVYKGRCVDESTGKSRFVAVKFMYSDLPIYAIEKARREAAIHFRHNNLIEMLGFIETESVSVLGEKTPHYHVVSELLEGVSLDKLFEGKLTDQQGHFVPFAEKLFKDYQQDVTHFSVEIIKNILSGLMTMHDAGYIHRDIDPSNIMITSNGNIKLIDFGIAKKFNSLTTHDKHLTQAGQFVGKPEYAAPELVLGAINEQNQTTDVYAVGILLFQCIVGHVPFEGDRSDILQKQLHSPMPLKLIKHKGLRKIIETATEKSRAKRFQSAAEFRVALDRLDLNDSGPISHINKRHLLFALAGCLLLGVTSFAAVKIINRLSQPSVEEANAQIVDVDKINIDDAYEDLDAGKIDEGMAKLRNLSEAGNSEATYMLSRFYFKSKLQNDLLPERAVDLQNHYFLPVDNIEAHSLLKKAVQQDSTNYRALYDLACDYWKCDQRTEAVENRDGITAKQLFSKALPLASEADDKAYVERIRQYLSDIKAWENNLKEL